LRVMTIFLRSGNALPIASKVFLPIKTECSMVFLLKYLKSFGKCQGIWLLMPIALFSEAATINVTVGLLILVLCKFLYYLMMLCIGKVCNSSFYTATGAFICACDS